MGRPIIAQKRGKGSLTYRVPNYSFKPKVEYRNQEGTVVDLVNHKIRNAPLAKVKYADRNVSYIVAPEGIRVGDSVSKFVVPLSRVSLGEKVFSIETYPNSGPKLCRTSGSSATVVSKDKKWCTLQLPSKKLKNVNLACRATLGAPAGDGRKEKPWVKAGKKYIAMHARGKYYPRTSGNKMNAVDHPFGGHARLGRQKSVSRHTPPGRKVGSIASRRTGKRKR